MSPSWYSMYPGSDISSSSPSQSPVCIEVGSPCGMVTSGYPRCPTVSSNILVSRFLLTAIISNWYFRYLLTVTRVIWDFGPGPGTFDIIYYSHGPLDCPRASGISQPLATDHGMSRGVRGSFGMFLVHFGSNFLAWLLAVTLATLQDTPGALQLVITYLCWFVLFCYRIGCEMYFKYFRCICQSYMVVKWWDSDVSTPYCC